MRTLTSLTSAGTGAGHEQALRRLEKENFRLREALDIAQEEIIQLKEKAKKAVVPEAQLESPLMAFGLSRREGEILKILLNRDGCGKEYILNQLYSMRSDVPDVKVLDIFICLCAKKYDRTA